MESTLKVHTLKVQTTFNQDLHQTKQIKIMFEKIKRWWLCTNHMTNKRLVMNESYRHWRNEMHHSWPIFKFKIIIIVNTQNPCYNNYCNRDFVVMSLVQLLYQWHHHTGSSRRKINAPFTLTDLPPEIFPFFFSLLGMCIKDNGEQEWFSRMYYPG